MWSQEMQHAEVTEELYPLPSLLGCEGKNWHFDCDGNGYVWHYAPPVGPNVRN
jgi:hypothetical protein